MSAIPSITPRTSLAVIVVLAVACAVSSIGWVLAARDGRGLPVECYTLKGSRTVGFDSPHGNGTRRAAFAVSESDDKVVLGYWNDVESGVTTMEAYSGHLTYELVQSLGGRPVVDPADAPIPRC